MNNMRAQTKFFVKGMIISWSGAIADIPGGFVLCDGANGTPDLRNRFLVGAGDTYNPDANGGTVNHNHTGITDEHSHAMEGQRTLQAGEDERAIVSNETVNFTTGIVSSLPPYFALAYIMKL